ncbi:LacI family DNA-binding transcriptional regulator [Brevibacillus daliensis]|uniref:LacI family DNA-binding transcriptional regulator n=1 Tax=Brevibacillus daliensis TaxID=2892995 RepID=UPI001E44005F|nr:LacI family DNA-binding transcriptional regulator [Brevibacillus daliensis]
MANIKQIAQLSGVSVTTVSRVLNHHPYVSDEKRQAVWKAVEKLSYTPNSNAVHLVKGKTGMIAIILPFVNHPCFALMLEGIAEQALQYNYRLIVCQSNYDTDEEIRVLEMLKTKQIDGVIIVSKKGEWDAITPYTAFGPIVACQKVDHKEISYVHIDRYAGTKQSFDYLVQKGYQNIAFCMGVSDTRNGKKRKEAYVRGVKALGKDVKPEWIFENCYQIEDGVFVARKLAEMKDRPEAILVAGDLPAAGIITEAKRLHWRVPEDLAVIGFDNLPIASLLDLTTMELPSFTMGQTSFQLLMERLEQGESAVPIKQVELPLRFFERGSA